MAFLHIADVRIKGVSSCVPKHIEENTSFCMPSEDIQKLIQTTGIERRRISNLETTTSDLCYYAAEQMLSDLNWSKYSIECLVFVTQTPDYILPATSCILQERLGLSQECHSIDISLGCSGWIYGLSSISSTMKSAGLKRGLLLVGDTISKIVSDRDKSTYPLFGDAGSCTAIELEEGSEGIKFHTATDGSGAESIIIRGGAYRNKLNENSLIRNVISDGISRNEIELELDGMNVFTFGISKAPQSVKKLVERYDLCIDNFDYFLFHQANMFMNEKIRKKLKLPAEKVPYSLRDFGNTSSTTIPLTITTQFSDKLEGEKSIIACGFGVGLSWGSVAFETSNIVCSKLIEI